MKKKLDYPFILRWLLTTLLLFAVWNGSRLALVIVLGLQALAIEVMVWLMKQKRWF